MFFFCIYFVSFTIYYFTFLLYLFCYVDNKCECSKIEKISFLMYSRVNNQMVNLFFVKKKKYLTNIHEIYIFQFFHHHRQTEYSKLIN